jgi:outer membrane protein assembly factor BamD
MNNLSKYLAFLLILVATVACSDYNKIVKSDNYQAKFTRANNLFDEKEFDRCIVLYEQVYQHTPKSGEGELAYYRLGKSYFEMEDYYMSGYYFSSYIQRFPYSAKTEEAYFLMSISNVKNSPEFALDQTETEQAIISVQSFIDRYPNSKLIDSCNSVIDNLRFKLERKDFEQVRLYSKTENFRSTVTAAEIYMEKYSKSKFIEETYYLLVKNSYLLSINSIPSKKLERIEQTNERFSNFVVLYPKSNYLKELKGYIDSIGKEKNN